MVNKILIKEIFRRFWQDRCLIYAQALTYDTVFALVPLLAFILSVVRFFIGTEDIIAEINEALSKFLNPGALSKVQSTIITLIHHAQTAPLGAASMMVFMAMALGLLMQLEDVLNKIFRVKTQRSFLQKITVYWLGLTLGPILVALPLGATVYLTHLGFKGVTLFSSFARFWTFFSIAFLFFGVFIYLPAKKIHFMPALIGAIFGGILWFFVATIYTIYTSKAVAYSKLYGSLSAIPFFLLWLFMNWGVMLFGAEIAGVFEQKDLVLAHYRYMKNQASILIGLGILIEVYQKHREGLPAPNEAELVQNLECSPFELERIIQQLKEASLIFEFEDQFFPSKDPSRILIAEIQEALMGKLPHEPPRQPSLKVAYDFLRTDCRVYTELTLKDLLERLNTVEFISQKIS